MGHCGFIAPTLGWLALTRGWLASQFHQFIPIAFKDANLTDDGSTQIAVGEPSLSVAIRKVASKRSNTI